MLASDVWIEKLAILSHEDAIYSVDPLSSEDVAVVVDFHWFTWRLQLRSTITVDGKDVRLITGVSLNSAQHDILPHRQSQLSGPTIKLHITTSLKSISQKRWLYHLIFKWSFWPVHFNQSISNNNVTCPIVLCPHWSNCLQLISLMIIHKYVNIQTSVVGPQ